MIDSLDVPVSRPGPAGGCWEADLITAGRGTSCRAGWHICVLLVTGAPRGVGCGAGLMGRHVEEGHASGRDGHQMSEEDNVRF